MTTEAKQIKVHNLEVTSDGNHIFTPKQWLERFRQNVKRKYKSELTRGAEMTETTWTEKEMEKQEDFI